VNVRLRFALAAYLRRCVINTDRGECAATASATLPMSTLPRPVRPWEPSTIRLQSWSSPALTIPVQVGAASIASLRARNPACSASEAPSAAVSSAACLTSAICVGVELQPAGRHEPDLERLPYRDDEGVASGR
jgi:hypothetical protein